MKLLKCIILFFIILALYIINSILMNDPPKWVPYLLSLISFWLNNLLELPKKVLIYFTSQEYYQAHESILKFIIPAFWTLISSFFIKNKQDQFKLLEKLDSGLIGNKQKYAFEPKGLKQKIFNSLGWFFLTDLEDFVLYRLSMLMPNVHRRTLAKQLRQMNRTHRMKTTEGGNITVTAFDKVSLLGKSKKILPQFDNDEPYECIIASGLLINKKNYIAVDLIVTKGVISRLQFQSDKNIESIKGSFVIQDIVIHHSLTDKKKLYGEEYDDENEDED